jgi:MFS family permease
MLLGSFLCIGSTIISSFCYSPFQFIFFFGFIFGIGAGLIFPAALYSGWSHLPDRKGMVTGIIIAGYGIGAFVTSFIAKRIINYNNEPSFFEEI